MTLCSTCLSRVPVVRHSFCEMAGSKCSGMLTDTRSTTLLLTGFVLLSLPAHAQPFCRTEVDETDPFTKVRVLSVASGRNKTGPDYRWRAVDKNLSLEIIWALPNTEPFAVLEGDPLLLMLENDSIVTLYSLRTEVADPRPTVQGTGKTTGSFEYRVSASEAKLLSKYWVRRIRLYHSEGFLEFGAEDDAIWQQGLEQLTTCFLHAYAATPLPGNTTVTQKAERPELFR
jgi:hypothetical protein